MILKKNRAHKDYVLSDVVLIITGCISPILEQRHLVLKDVNERLRQYVESLEYYINESPFCNIIFCENSGYKTEQKNRIFSVANCKGKNFEWLSFHGNLKKSAIYGNKGIGEDEIMNYIMNESKLINNVHSFVKITGRLIIKNINQLSESICLGENYFYRNMYGLLNHVDTRFYVMDILYYKIHIQKCYERVGQLDMPYEEVFYILMDGHYKLLPVYPRVHGASSGNGTIYDNEGDIKLRILDFLCNKGLYNQVFPLIYYYLKIEKKLKRWLRF